MNVKIDGGTWPVSSHESDVEKLEGVHVIWPRGVNDSLHFGPRAGDVGIERCRYTQIGRAHV